MNFELQPALKGKMVELRPMVPQDFEALFAAASDPLIWEQHPEPLRYRREVFQLFFDGAMASKGALVVIDIESGKVIGGTRFYEYDSVLREVKIGYTFLARAFWGRGYNFEIKTLMLHHAFQCVGKVFFQVGENNIRSQRALQKLGARLIGKEDLPGLDGTPLHCVIFIVTRNRE